MASEDFDRVDAGILARLQGDARNVTTTAIAEDLDLAASTVATRLSRLESEGFVEGYWPELDYERLGFDHRVLVTGTIAGDGDVEDLAAVEGVVAVQKLLTDDANVVLDVVGRSADELEAQVDRLGDLGVEVLRTEVVERRLFHPTSPLPSPDESGT